MHYLTQIWFGSRGTAPNQGVEEAIGVTHAGKRLNDGVICDEAVSPIGQGRLTCALHHEGDPLVDLEQRIHQIEVDIREGRRCVGLLPLDVVTVRLLHHSVGTLGQHCGCRTT